MAVFTSTDLTNVKNAYLALATGERTVQVSWGDKTQIFAQTDMGALKTLLGEITNDLDTTGADGSFRIVQRGKNL